MPQPRQLPVDFTDVVQGPGATADSPAAPSWCTAAAPTSSAGALLFNEIRKRHAAGEQRDRHRHVEDLARTVSGLLDGRHQTRQLDPRSSFRVWTVSLPFSYMSARLSACVPSTSDPSRSTGGLSSDEERTDRLGIGPLATSTPTRCARAVWTPPGTSQQPRSRRPREYSRHPDSVRTSFCPNRSITALREAAS